MKQKLLAGLVGLMVLSGCATNHYKITTLYTDPAERITITSEVEGKATIGKTAFIFQKVLGFIDDQYLKKK